MTFICTYCGEWVNEKYVKYDNCTRCGEPRKMDKEARDEERNKMRKYLIAVTKTHATTSSS